MKFNRLAFCILAASLTFAACEKTEEPTKDPVEKPGDDTPWRKSRT